MFPSERLLAVHRMMDRVESKLKQYALDPSWTHLYDPLGSLANRIHRIIRQ